MARIRTIKPDFFTSEDIVSLSPLARLLYIALWCEADREGRMKWRPGTLKTRYLPADPVDINVPVTELLERRLVVLYGDGLAWIPTFTEHQYVNPREAKSFLPDPSSVDNSPVLDASSRVSDTHVGRKERKGKERNDASSRVEGQNQWWKTNEGIKAKGEELGLPAQPGESFIDWKRRIFTHLGGNGQGKAAPQSCAYCHSAAVGNVGGIAYCSAHFHDAIDRKPRPEQRANA